jgi:hypothetical protein
MKLRFRRLVAWLLWIAKPWTTVCQRCGWPWGYAKPHLYYFEPNQSIFFCCEWCWPQTRGVTRLFYAMLVVRGVGRGRRKNQPWPEDKAQKVMDALGDEPA